MKRHFDQELKLLTTDLLRMAALTEDAIRKAVGALEKSDVKMAEEVVAFDNHIDELELAIEERAIDLLALRQPMAIDLRFITTGMKINAELERIADLAENIAQRAIELHGRPAVKPLVDIPRLAQVARTMVKGAIDAFVNRDEKLAQEVILRDSEADSLRNAVYAELTDCLVKDGAIAPKALPLILTARHLERICDHASYIAADVIYMIDAKVVKHHIEELDDISGPE